MEKKNFFSERMAGFLIFYTTLCMIIQYKKGINIYYHASGYIKELQT
jgi:hypothetical protein